MISAGSGAKVPDRSLEAGPSQGFALAPGHLQAQTEARQFEDLLGDPFQENLSGSRAAQRGQFFTPPWCAG